MSTALAGLPSPAAALPKISLVTPSFNQAEYLEATLRSVLEQGYPNLEYIVVDGGSTDGSVALIERYSDRLAYWTSAPDHGHADALNKGFVRATGEILGWINSDDLLLPGSLLLVGSLFAQFPEMEWLTSPGAATEPGGRIVAVHDGAPWTRSYFLRARDRWIQQESTFWRRSLWQRAGIRLDEELIACDHELWARFFRHARLYQTSGLIGAFRHRAEQRSIRLRERYLQEMAATVARERARRTAWSLSDDEAEVLSAISFDTERMEFISQHVAVAVEEWRQQFCVVEDSLLDAVELPALAPPPGGVEVNSAIRRFFPTLLDSRPARTAFAWLGSGSAAGLRVALRCALSRTVSIRFLAVPGPSAGERDVTLRLSHQANGEEQTGFDIQLCGEQKCQHDFELSTGSNEISMHVLEPAAVSDLGTGDPRHLMAAICEIRVAPADVTGEA